ncbi:MAG: InlB B-repeat-containing protein [Bacteroidaceae bacterium]|nr:InlB B-repeat-containing protein [Bacteroidaceae bacterium]
MKRLLSIVMGFVVALSALQAQNKVSLSSVDFVKGESAVMTVDLQNEITFSAFQMDLTLPEGFAIATVKGSDKLDITLDEARKHSSHILSYNQKGNKVRITAYSSSNANLTGNSGKLLSIGLIAKEAALPGVYQASVDNVLFTTAEEEEIELANAVADIKLKYVVENSVTDASLGSISISGNPYHGEKQTVTVSPIEHYELDKLLVNGVDVTNKVKDNVYTITSLESNVNAIASFKPMTYVATFVIDGQTIAEKPILYSAAVEAPAAPAKEGHTFDGWKDVPATMPGKNITITGSYTVNNYTVTFKIGDEVIFTKSMAYGTKITAPEAPAKEGHTFAGWGEVAATVPAKDVTYTGTYTVNKYTLTFTADGKTVQTGEVAYGTKIVAPEAPAKEGHTFDGWKDVPATMPAKAVTINGTYTINNYTVTFKIGDEVIFTKSMAYGTKITAPEAPAKEGHTFAGWGEVAATVPAKDVTYTGTYTVNKYTLTFTADGKTVQTGEVAYGTAIVAPEAPAKEGYTFDGWKDVPATMPAKAVTINGTYTVNNYTVTFKIGDEVIFTKSMAYGTAIVAPEAPAKEGHTFAGWGEVAETVPANDVTYEGTYTANSYIVTYVVDGEVYKTESVVYGAQITAITAPEKVGYTFSGWSEIPATMPAEEVKVYGTFAINSYLVTFKIGDEVIASDSLEYGAAIIAPEAPAKEGHTFAGWGEVAATVPASDVTYEGTYTVNNYTVTFKIGDEVIYSESLPYGTEITAPEAPAKEGHTFAGWGEVAATVPASDVTYEGTYTVNSYTVTFKIGDEVIFSESMAYGTEIVAPEAPEKEGYTFDGWGEVAATVPANDVTYEGTYTVNVYNVYYYVGEELVHTAEVAYGEVIPEYIYEPTTEGDVFVGWIGETYETMPAHDVTYTANIESGIGQLTIDKSQLTIYDLTGRRITDTENLKGGIYIVNGKKVIIK